MQGGTIHSSLCVHKLSSQASVMKPLPKPPPNLLSQGLPASGYQTLVSRRVLRLNITSGIAVSSELQALHWKPRT